MCYIGPYSTYSTYSKEPGESGCSAARLVRYSTYSRYSKEPGESGCSVACLVRYSTYSTYSKEPGESGCSVACLVRYSTYSTYSKDPGESYSTYSTYSKEPGESGCSVACLVRYSTYSTYSKGPGDCEGSAWCLPRLATLPRLPGIGALPSPRQGRDCSYRGRDSDFALHRGRFSDFALASDFARKIPGSDAVGSASLPELGFIPKTPSPGQRRRSVSDAARTASLTECFFTTHTPCRQSWRGHTQSWRGHRIATPVFPRKRWKRSAVQHYAPRLAARIARKTPAVRRYTPMHSRTRRPAPCVEFGK